MVRLQQMGVWEMVVGMGRIVVAVGVAQCSTALGVQLEVPDETAAARCICS